MGMEMDESTQTLSFRWTPGIKHVRCQLLGCIVCVCFPILIDINIFRRTISALVRIVDDICTLYMKSVGTEIFGRGAGKGCDCVCDEIGLNIHTRRTNKVEVEMRREKRAKMPQISTYRKYNGAKYFSFRFVPFRLLHVCLYVTSLLLLVVLVLVLLLLMCAGCIF